MIIKYMCLLLEKNCCIEKGGVVQYARYTLRVRTPPFGPCFRLEAVFPKERICRPPVP